MTQTISGTSAAALLALALLTAPLSGAAHTAWLEEDPATPGVYRVLFGGHGGQLEPLEPAKLLSVTALDAQGDPVAVARADGEHGSRISPQGPVALMAMHYDNGIWSRDPMGRSVNEPLAAVPGATEATWAVKYHKAIVRWAPVVREPLDQPFEVIPLSDRQPVAGEPMSVRVLVDGEPAAGVRLGQGEQGDAGTTDADGIARFVPRAGFNRLWAGQRRAVEAPTHTELSYEYLLAFEAAPAP